MKNYQLLFFSLLFGTLSYAQVGVNTTTIDPSAALDIQFQDPNQAKGLLTPRMNTVQRTTKITSPADGLIVYDTDLKSFYHYNASTSSWVKMNSEANGRSKFKRIKSVADLAPELSGGKYVLATDTYYEVNGTIIVDAPIDINNAYLVGLDANEDRLIKNSGILFQGTKGGTIKNLTISKAGGSLQVFDLTGDATGSPLVGTQNLIVRDCIIAGCNSIGTVSGFNLAFFAVVQYASNTTGITFSNTAQLLLSNIGWFGNNSGTFETFTGSFNLLQKLGGFSDVKSGAIGVDVSSNPTIINDAVLESVVFTGASSQYVKPYTVGTYTGFNFNNRWNVRSAGIPNETDADATGNLYYQSSSVVNLNSTTAFKLPVNTNSIRLFRTAEGAGANSENRLIYEGAKSRALNVLGALSFTATAGSRYVFSIYKNGSKVTGSDVEADVTTTNARQSVSIIGTVDVVKNDYIEIYMQKPAPGSEQILITTYNFIFN